MDSSSFKLLLGLIIHDWAPPAWRTLIPLVTNRDKESVMSFYAKALSRGLNFDGTKDQVHVPT